MFFQTWAAELPRLNYQLAIVRRQEPNLLLGCCGLRSIDSIAGEMEFGIELAPEYWGWYAYAIEAGRAMLDFGFGELNLGVISGSTIAQNVRITRLAEWFGAQLVATSEDAVPNQSWREVNWRITKDKWESRITA